MYYHLKKTKKRKLSRTFGDAVERFLWEGQEACDGGYVDDASPAGDGGIPEERVRELAEVEARLQVGRHDPRVRSPPPCTPPVA